VASALFAAALLSKTMILGLPVVVLLLQWWRRGRIDRRAAALMAPWFLMGALAAAATIRVEHIHMGAQSEQWELSLIERVLVAGRALWFYLMKLVWPDQLA